MSIPFFREPNQVLTPNIPRSTVVVTQPVAFTPPPPLSEWTWVNQGPYDDPTDFPLLTTADDIPGGIRFTVPSFTNWPAIILANDPLPDPPYTITMAFRVGTLPTHAEVGLVVHNSDTGVAVYMGVSGHNGQWYASEAIKFSATTEVFDYVSFLNTGTSLPMYPVVWLRIQNDGSVMHLFGSPDGVIFVEIGAVDSSEFGSMDHYGLFLYNYYGSSNGPIFLESYYSNEAGGPGVIDLLSVEIGNELLMAAPFLPF